MMMYAILVYEPPSAFQARQSDDPGHEAYSGAYGAYMQALSEAGVFRPGTVLEPPETASTLRVNGSGRRVQDGPYADTKEQLGGMFLIEVPDLDAALEWAARCPAASTGAVEVRPVGNCSE